MKLRVHEDIRHKVRIPSGFDSSQRIRRSWIIDGVLGGVKQVHFEVIDFQQCASAGLSMQTQDFPLATLRK